MHPRDLLTEPLTRGLDVDDPSTTVLRRYLIRHKPLLRDVYEEWYQRIASALPPVEAPTLELGAGAGFLSEFLPRVITSEIFICPGIRAVLDGQQLPFREASLGAVVMTDVLHHLPRVRRFFAEAVRCLIPGGAIIAIEPWNTTWSRPIYRWLHPEPFATRASTWEFPPTGPLSGANGALPWIIFERDRYQFSAEFPALRVVSVVPFMPFRYLISGGVSLRSLVPQQTRGISRSVENLLSPWSRHLGMFACISLQKVSR